MDYLNDLKIDENNLNNIVDTQAVVSMQYHELFCEKLEEMNEQKRKVQIEKAELEEIYAKLYLLNKRSGEKITEKENDSMILVNPDYKNKQTQYFEEVKNLNAIDKSFNILEGVIKNMQQRKNMIEEKIKLIMLGFNGTPKQNFDNIENKILNKLNKGE